MNVACLTWGFIPALAPFQSKNLFNMLNLYAVFASFAFGSLFSTSNVGWYVTNFLQHYCMGEHGGNGL